MASVMIFPGVNAAGNSCFRAVTKVAQSEGATVGQALDAIREKLTTEESSTLVIVQSFAPDRYFTASQQARLAELMAKWRATRDLGEELPAAEAEELRELVAREFAAANARTTNLLRDLGE